VCSTFHNLSLFNKEYDCCSTTACLVISSHRNDLYRPFPPFSMSRRYFTPTLTSTASSIYLEVWSIFTHVQTVYDRVTWKSGGYLLTTSPLRLHVLQDGGVQRRRAIDYTNLHGVTHVRIFSRTFFIKQYFQKFWALSEGPRGSKPTSSNSSPRATYPRFFSRLSTSSLTKGFTQALPTSNVTPTPMPTSDSSPCVTYPTSFSRPSTSI